MKIISTENNINVNNLSIRNKKKNNSLQSYKLGFGNNHKGDSIEIKDKKKKKDKAIGMSLIPLAGALVLGMAAYGKKHSNKTKNEIGKRKKEIKAIVEKRIQKPLDIDSKHAQKIFGSPINNPSQVSFDRMTLDEKRKHIMNFFTLSDRNLPIMSQRFSYIIYSKKNNIFQKDDKDIIEKLETPSDNPEILNRQCLLATAVLSLGILTKNKRNKELITNLLKNPSSEPDTLSNQCELVQDAISLDILSKNEENEELITNLLKNPSPETDTFLTQCSLAKNVINLNLLTHNKENEEIITNLLKNPSPDPDTFLTQCYLVETAVRSKILTNNNNVKELITNLLKYKSKNPNVLNQQRTLAQFAKYLKILNTEDKTTNQSANVIGKNKRAQSSGKEETPAEKRIHVSFDRMTLDEKRKHIMNFFSLSDKNWQTMSQRYSYIIYAQKNNIFQKDDKDIIEKLETPSDNPEILNRQCLLATAVLSLGILTKNKRNKELITNLLKNPSSDPRALKIQCELAQSAINSYMLTKNKKNEELITNLLKNPSSEPETFSTQCYLAQRAINSDILTKNKENEELITNLLKSPSPEPETFSTKCYLAEMSVRARILTNNNNGKEVITNLLKDQSKHPNVLNQQRSLAKVAKDFKILNTEDKATNQSANVIGKNKRAQSSAPQEIPAAKRIVAFDRMTLDAKRRYFMDFWSLPDKSYAINTPESNSLNYAIKNKIFQKDDKEIMAKFETPSDDPTILKSQCHWAKIALSLRILTKNKRNKELLTNLLKNPSPDPKTLEIQGELAIMAVRANYLNIGDNDNNMQLSFSDNSNTNPETPTIYNQEYLAKIIINLLTGPSDVPATVNSQSELARIAMENKVIRIEDKELVLELLNRLSSKNENINLQYQVATHAINNKILSIRDKEIVLNLLDKSNLEEGTLKNQMILAKAAILNNILTSDYRDKETIRNFINRLGSNPKTEEFQSDLAILAVKNKILNSEDKDFILTLLQPKTTKPYITDNQYVLAGWSVDKQILKNEDKELILSLLNQETNSRSAVFQCRLAAWTVKMKILKNEDKELILKMLNQKTTEPNLISTQCELASNAIVNKILNDSDKETIERLLKTPDGIIGTQCNLAMNVINNLQTLGIEDLSFLENLMKRPHKNWYDLGEQCRLELVAISYKGTNEIIKNIAEDKEIIKSLLSAAIPKHEHRAIENQYMLARAAVKNKLIDKNEHDIIKRLCLVEDLNNDNELNKLDLIIMSIKNKIFDKSDLNEIMSCLQHRSNNIFIFIHQCKIAKALLEEGILENRITKPNIFNMISGNFNPSDAIRKDDIREYEHDIITGLLTPHFVVSEITQNQCDLALEAIEKKMLDPKLDSKVIKGLYMYPEFKDKIISLQFDLLNIAIDNQTLNVNYKDESDVEGTQIQKRDRDYKAIINDYLNLSIEDMDVTEKQLNFVIKLLEKKIVNVNDANVVSFILRQSNVQNVPVQIKELHDRLMQIGRENEII